MKKKAYLQISFAWLFAIIVGIAILFLAIYGVSKMTKTESMRQNIETSKEIRALLNPLETSFESAKINTISFPAETRIYNLCDSSGDFGKQKIKISQKNFNKFTQAQETSFENKYIFSGKIIEGKNFYIFSKPFKFPFKIADLIYLIPYSSEYCFINAPENIKTEINDLQEPNLIINNCTDKSIKVCFGAGNCDINVNYDAKYVKKNSGVMYFEGDALMYGAIFSNKSLYECQLKRLMKRTAELALIYKNKGNFISNKCDSGLNPDLLILESNAGKFKDSSELYQLNFIASELQDKNNDNWECRLW